MRYERARAGADRSVRVLRQGRDGRGGARRARAHRESGQRAAVRVAQLAGQGRRAARRRDRGAGAARRSGAASRRSRRRVGTSARRRRFSSPVGSRTSGWRTRPSTRSSRRSRATRQRDQRVRVPGRDRRGAAASRCRGRRRIPMRGSGRDVADILGLSGDPAALPLVEPLSQRRGSPASRSRRRGRPPVSAERAVPSQWSGRFRAPSTIGRRSTWPRDLLGKVLVHDRRGVRTSGRHRRGRGVHRRVRSGLSRRARPDGAQPAALRHARPRLRLPELRHPLPGQRRDRSRTDRRRRCSSARSIRSRASSVMRRRRARAAKGRRPRTGVRAGRHDLCRGPGNLTMAMGITLAREPGRICCGDRLFIEDRGVRDRRDRVGPANRDPRRHGAPVARVRRRTSGGLRPAVAGHGRSTDLHYDRLLDYRLPTIDYRLPTTDYVSHSATVARLPSRAGRCSCRCARPSASASATAAGSGAPRRTTVMSSRAPASQNAPSDADEVHVAAGDRDLRLERRPSAP